MTDVVTSYVDALKGKDDFDIVADFAALFPVEIISSMLGVPRESASRSGIGPTGSCTASRTTPSPPKVASPTRWR